MPSATQSGVRPLRVALIGNPNTGKSTLFNALAGMNVRTGNYPGVTVEKKTGRAVWNEQSVELIDLPGTYSLAPQSPDEMVTVEVLTGIDRRNAPDIVVCVCNATALDRNLFLVMQVREIGIPTVVCLNMFDAAQKAGLQIDLAALSRLLGLPVVAASALRRTGFEQLHQAVLQAALLPHSDGPNVTGSEFPDVVLVEVERLTQWLHQQKVDSELSTRFLVTRSLLDPGGSVEKMLQHAAGDAYSDQLMQSRRRLEESSCPVAGLEATHRYAAINQIVSESVRSQPVLRKSVSDRLDSVLTHRVFGFLICIAVMLLIFSTINWFSQPLSAGVEAIVGAFGDAVTSSMAPGPFRSLLIDGVFAGVGGVLVFLPQIALLFLFIAVLEDCGYMARAAFMMDRLMAFAGLSGRSFLPLMSSFACAVPGIMATRSIEDRSDRFVTILIAPLMSCSARLPVYVLLTGAFVPDQFLLGGLLPLRAVVLLVMSLLGLFVAIPIAFLLRKTLFRGQASTFLLELPDYRFPSLRVVGNRVWESSWSFVQQAGTLIFATTVVIWAAASYPGSHTESYALTSELESLETQDDPNSAVLADALRVELNRIDAEQLENSLLGRLGHQIEPLVRPLGWDWRIGVGVVASFPAREVIVATLGTIFSLGTDVTEEDESLRGALTSATRPDGSPVFNLPVAFSIMVFFALCAQCVSTLVVMRRETNSWRWPVFSFVYMTVLAWCGAFVTYQIGMLL